MPSYVQDLHKKGLISPPSWLPMNTMFEGLTGSVAYAVSNDTSDMDIYGFCVPPKDYVFPHLRGELPGFGRQIKRFDQYQQHHVEDKERRKTFDLTIFSIVKFFHLAMENNPNMVDVMFLPRRCVLHSTGIYEHVRENRKLFLHKGSWHKFRGYSFAQMSKIKGKSNASNPKRKETIEEFGFDTKFAYHVVRLLLEIEQILTEHDLDLERNREILKSVRRGEWTLDQLDEWATVKERSLEQVYAESTLPHSPDEEKIKSILLECLEMHYGSLSQVINTNQGDALLRDLVALVDKYR